MNQNIEPSPEIKRLVCFVCGHIFKNELANICPTCNWHTCPACGACFCKLTNSEKRVATAMFQTYVLLPRCDAHAKPTSH